MKTWFTGLKLVWKLVVFAAIILVGFLTYNFVDDYFSKADETAAEISENQAEAAIESGQDAVNTVTNQYTREVERYHTVERIAQEVNDAKDIDSAHDAGSRGLCDEFRVCPEDRVQQPNP